MHCLTQSWLLKIHSSTLGKIDTTKINFSSFFSLLGDHCHDYQQRTIIHQTYNKTEQSTFQIFNDLKQKQMMLPAKSIAKKEFNHTITCVVHAHQQNSTFTGLRTITERERLRKMQKTLKASREALSSFYLRAPFC